MNNPIKAIIFDVDGTLSNGSSWQLLTEGLGGDFDQVLNYYHQLQNKQISLELGTQGVVKAMSVKGPVTKLEVQKIYEGIGLKDNAAQVIANLQKQYRLCLISGSTDLYVASVAQKLSIKDYYACSSYIFDASDVLQDFIYQVDQSRAKVEYLQDFCQKNNISAKECAVVGDSGNDLGVFKLAGTSVFISSHISDLELKRIADYRINDLAELLNIF